MENVIVNHAAATPRVSLGHRPLDESKNMNVLVAGRRGSVVVAYALFILVGLSAGAPTVLIVDQMDDYGVGPASIGLTFFTFSAGFVLAGATSGPLIHRWGTRLALLGGALAFTAAGLAVATRPSFWVFIALQVVAGYGGGLIESVLNAHLAAMPRSTTLLNRLHAFFGIGAFIAPTGANWLLDHTTWPMVILAITLVGLPIFVAVWFTYPTRATDPLAPAGSTGASGKSGSATGARPEDKEPGLLAAVLREPAVLLGALLLTVYVGLEIAVGNWGFNFLIQGREAADTVAGLTMSGYWLGLTAGRFVLSPLATRLGLTKIGLLYLSMFGVAGATVFSWLAPTAGLAAPGFVLLGFFLGPIFPTIMAVAPDLTSARLAPTAIGVINAGSVVGGAALPWLAGALGQGLGVWTLLPFALVLAAVQLLVLWRMTARMARPAARPVPAAGEPTGEQAPA
jgi:fucose permease